MHPSHPVHPVHRHIYLSVYGGSEGLGEGSGEGLGLGGVQSSSAEIFGMPSGM